jgi:hypothetical protein
VNRFLDFIIATQLSTSFAWMCAIGAHLIDKYANENWQFSVYVLLGVTVLFMLAPYTFLCNEENHCEPAKTR